MDYVNKIEIEQFLGKHKRKELAKIIFQQNLAFCWTQIIFNSRPHLGKLCFVLNISYDTKSLFQS